MKVLLVNGSPHREGCTYTALNECAKTFLGAGIEVEWYWIGVNPVAGCSACMRCSGTGKCQMDDSSGKVNELIDAITESDAVIIGSPVYFAGMNGHLKAIMDRAFYAGNAAFAYKPAAGIASARRAGTTLTIDQINKYFQITGMPLASSTYWPMIHGTKAEEAQRDAEGLQTMRNLAKQMIWMLKRFAAATKAGIAPVELTKEARTSFMDAK